MARSKLIELGTSEGATLVLLVKEIGTDALLALRRVLARNKESQGLARLEAFYQNCRKRDLALAVAQTDVKGDRSKRPSEQADPGYVRARGGKARRRNRGERRESAYLLHALCGRSNRAAESEHGRRGRSLVDGFRGAHGNERAAPVLFRFSAWHRRCFHAAHFHKTQNDRNAHGIRQCVRAVGARIFRRAPRSCRRHGAYVRRISPFHRRELQTSVAGRAGGRRESPLPKPMASTAPDTCAKSSPGLAATRKRFAGSPNWPRCAAKWKKALPSRTCSRPTWLSGPSRAIFIGLSKPCRISRADYWLPARPARTGIRPRCGPCWKNICAAHGPRTSAWRCSI